MATKSDKVSHELAAWLCSDTDTEIIDALVDCVQERCRNSNDTEKTITRIAAIFSNVLPEHLRHHHRLHLYHGLADKLAVAKTPIALPDQLEA